MRVSSPGCASPAKLATLLWRVRPRRRSGWVRLDLHQHLDGAPDEALGTLTRAALHELDEALHARHLLLVGHELLVDRARGGPGAGRR